MLLIDIAKRCNEIFDAASKDLGNDLQGGSVLDLCADNIEGVSLFDLKCAIVCAGIYARAGKNVQKQIALYR